MDRRLFFKISANICQNLTHSQRGLLHLETLLCLAYFESLPVAVAATLKANSKHSLVNSKHDNTKKHSARHKHRAT